jgi:hypothetical protein
MLIAADARNSHQVAVPKPTRTGMAKGAVGGRYARTLKKEDALPEVAVVRAMM